MPMICQPSVPGYLKVFRVHKGCGVQLVALRVWEVLGFCGVSGAALCTSIPLNPNPLNDDLGYINALGSCRVIRPCTRFGVQGLGFRIQGLGIRV